MKNWSNIGLYILIGLVIIAFASTFLTNTSTVKDMPFSEFMNSLNSGSIKEVTIEGGNVSGTLADGSHFKTYMPQEDQSVYKSLKENNVVTRVIPANRGSIWVTILSFLVPVVLIIAFWMFIMRQSQGGGGQGALSFGKSKAKLMVDMANKVTFADVAGVDEAKVELAEVVEFLKAPERFQALGAKIPRGVLLVGAPGTGKTLLAKAVAGEAGVPFFSISGSDFVEMFVGVGASRVRSLFEQAKKASPCIVFIDEIDAVGRQRGIGLGGGNDEREQTLNQLLVEMDGFEPNQNIIIIAATNRPDILDNALLRPGRFDRQVVVDKPDVKGRKQILGVHAKGKPLSGNIDLEVIARRTPGFTGADLANVINEAGLLAARRNSSVIEMVDLESAIDKVIMGSERRSRVISESEKEIVAYHELGHAIVAKLTPGSDPVHKVSIIPRGMALGVTMQLPEEDKYLHSKTYMQSMITVLLGGRVAEKLIFDEITTGASNDIERATAIARSMVTTYGMTDALGPLAYGSRNESMYMGRSFGEDRNFSEQTSQAIDKEIRRIVSEAYDKATQILTEKKDAMIKLAAVLREKETMDGSELDEALGLTPPPENPVTEDISIDGAVAA